MKKQKINLDFKGYYNTFRKKWWLLLIEAAVFAGIIALDLCIKDFLFEFLEENGSPYVLWEGFLNLRYSENYGAGFGMFGDSPITLIVLTTILVVGLLAFLVVALKYSEWLRVPLIMIAAGGIGNLADRIELGYVRDFFEYDFMDFAIFNIADVFVTVGAIMLIIYLIYIMVVEAKKSKEVFKAEQQAAEGGESENSVCDNCAEEVRNGFSNETAEQDAKRDEKTVAAYDIKPLDEADGEIDFDADVNDGNRAKDGEKGADISTVNDKALSDAVDFTPIKNKSANVADGEAND